MKKLTTVLAILLGVILAQSAYSQTNTYTTSGGEVIFSWGELKYTDAFKSAYPGARIEKHPVRFTVFFHLQQFWHLDLNNNLGFFTGVGVRNIGMISDEVLPDNYTSANPGTFNAKIIRRTYSIGIPLAVKLGSFKDHLNVYAGGEMEWAFHMKEKWWDSHSRSGSKTKNTSWWPNQINTFLPSAFVGFQFPGGVNLKFRYYLEDFLNHDYQKTNVAADRSQVVSDLTKYNQSSMFYVSLAFHFKTAKLIQQIDKKALVTD